MTTDVLLISEARIATVQLLERVLAHLARTTDLTTRSRLLDELRPDDITAQTYPLLVRTIHPDAYALTRTFRRTGVGYGFYLDDNFWLLDPATEIGRHYAAPARRRILEAVVRHASTVIASTPLLQSYLATRNPNVIQLDSFFDFTLIPRLPAAPSGRRRLRGGFAASADRVQDLRPVIGDVIGVLDEHDDVEFEFIGVDDDELPDHPRIRTFPYRTSYRDYIEFQRSRRWDFGLAPLGTAASNLYKTDNKFREYAAQGIPGIYEDAPPYASVRDGATGLLAGTSRTWKDAIHLYVTDPALRARVRREARADAEARSALETVAPQWQRFFEQAPPLTDRQVRQVRAAIRRRSTFVARTARRIRALTSYGREQLSETGIGPTAARTTRFLWKKVTGR